MNKTKISYNQLTKVSQLVVVGLLLLPFAATIILSQKAGAAQLTKTFVRLDSLVASATSVSGRICFQPDVTTTINSVRITFPTTNGATDYVLQTNTNWTTNTSNLDTLPVAQTALTMTSPAASVSGKQVVFNTAAPLSANTSNLYCFNWAGTSLTNPAQWTTESVPGTFETFSSAGASGLISSSSFSLPKTVTTNGTNVSVSATVPPSFQFTLNNTVDTFGTVNIAGVNTTPGVTATVVTNAGAGWIIWARSYANNGSCTRGCLWSPSKAASIMSSTATGGAATLMATGSERYEFAVTAKSASGSPVGSCASANITPTTYFDGITNANYAGPLDKVFMPIASCNGTSTNATVTFREALTVTAVTPAATDYADTIIMTAAGQF